MRGFLGFAIAAVLLFCNAHANNLTVTEDLTAAQTDLRLTHAFVETAIFMNRGQLSAALGLINRAVLDSHIDTYAFIKNIAMEVQAEIDAVEINDFNEHCLEVLNNRWDLQVRRYGILLSNCVVGANDLISSANAQLNQLHIDAQDAKFVQNVGVRVFTETTDFTGRNQFGDTINREHRQVFSRFIVDRSRFEDFVQEMVDNYEDTIRELIECDRELEESFVEEQLDHMNHLRRCEH